MATYEFSALANLQRLAFDPRVDAIVFDRKATALEVDETGDAVRLVLGTKTVFLDGVSLESLRNGAFQFPAGSLLRLGDGTATGFRDWYGLTTTFSDPKVAVQVQALGGADALTTSGAGDVLVGNDPLVPIVQVSRVGSTGSPNASSDASVSADGRFVAFYGGWTGFGSQSNSSTDVLVKDMGDFGLSGSGRPEISADGKSLVFWSNSALVPDAPGSTIYKSAVSGPGITAVSATAGGAFANGPTDNPAVSADGRYVAFQSRATNLAAGGEATYDDIFVKDTATGALWRASTSLGGGDANADCRDADISADGRYVVFSSYATNLSANDGSYHADVYLWDRTTQKLTNVTGGKGGDFDVLNPRIASDGTVGGVVVFETGKSLAAADTNNATDIYAYRIADGSFTRVSTRADGSQVALASGSPAVSGDGRFVVFTSGSEELVGGDSNGWRDVFVKDLKTGAIALVSKAANGTQANQHSGHADLSLGGDWIVFESGASNLAASNANGSLDDVFRVSNPLLFDTLRGGAGDDLYIVNRRDVIVEGANAGNDTVQSSISWTLGENLENLVLTGVAAINGTGNALANRITGNEAKNTLSGQGGNDTLLGGGGNDSLVGGAGNDRLDGGAGSDTMVGGEGGDTYIVDAATDIVTEMGTTAGDADTVVSAVTWTLGGTLENLTLSGSNAINGSGNSQANLITGNSANNTLNGQGANDTLLGGGGNDSLIGGAGNDRLDGGAGSDTMVGGEGSDTYLTESATDIISEIGTTAGNVDSVISSVGWTLGSTLENLTLTGTTAVRGNGNGQANVLTGNAAHNTMNGGGGNDTVSGAAGNDSLLGGVGNDSLNGGTGNDTMVGGEGSDTYVCDAAGDIISESGTTPGNVDSVISSVDWTLGSTLENLTLTGTTAVRGNGNGQANVLIGNAAHNTMNGGGGNDSIGGGAGNDTLQGGAGSDRLTGGTGADRFVFDSTSGSDTITDFASGIDKVAFRMAQLGVGNGNTTIDGAQLKSAPGGFSTAAELVVFTTNAPALTNTAAAAAIGSANSAYAAGAKALFTVDDGTSSAVFLFSAANANAAVEAAELTLLATLQGAAATALADYAFIA